MTCRLLTAALICFAAPVAAQEEFADPSACLARQVAAQRPAADCVNEAQVACFQFEEASAAATACFHAAKAAWGGLIAARMQAIVAQAPEEIAAIAGIEVKYDLRGNLMQCDRMEDLSLIRSDPDATTLFARARCEATAVGLAYAKLWLQSESLK